LDHHLYTPRRILSALLFLMKLKLKRALFFFELL
jgi:hypothetical protein